jgi:hypothetical protein
MSCLSGLFTVGGLCFVHGSCFPQLDFVQLQYVNTVIVQSLQVFHNYIYNSTWALFHWQADFYDDLFHYAGHIS